MEAKVAEEKAACAGDRGSDLEDEGPAVAEPSVVEFATIVVVDVNVDAVAAVVVAAAGRAVDAGTRLGIRLGDCEDRRFWGGGGKGQERDEGGCWMGWASSSLLVVSALARYGTCCASNSCLL